MAHSAQQATPQESDSVHLPYGFSNFVWWGDDELRSLLKKRVPGLGDEIGPSSAVEGKVRDALTALLKEKGIVAEVQSIEPSPSEVNRQREQWPGLPGVQLSPRRKPKIEFSILAPQVLIGKIAFIPQDAQVWRGYEGVTQRNQGKRFDRLYMESLRDREEDTLEQQGYLSAKVELSLSPPRLEDAIWVVDLTLSAKAGPQYSISAINVDGGSLLRGQDLSQLLDLKVGDLASSHPFTIFERTVRADYEHAGYMDVDIETKPTLDVANAKVAYRVSVTEGPQYHLRSLTIHGLTPNEENHARELLGMKIGDVYDGTAVTDLNQKLRADILLTGLGFSFDPAQEKTTRAIDLTLNFSKARVVIIH